MADRISNPIDPIKQDIEEIITEKGGEFHRLYDDTGIVCDPKTHQVKYVLKAGMAGSYTIKLSGVYHIMGGEDKDLSAKLMELRYKI